MSVQAIDRIQPLWTDLQTEGMRLDAGAEVGGTRRTQFLSDLISLGSTTVADIAVHSRNQESDFILRPSTKATPFLCL